VNFFTSEDLADLRGLKPRASFVVGPGFSREELKDIVLDQVQGISSSAVLSLLDVARLILGVDAKRILRPSTRREWIAQLVDHPSLKARFSRLRMLKKQTGFYSRLDRALQAGRMSYSGEAEYEVLTERLRELGFSDRVRPELEALAQGYENVLRSKNLWDEPLLLEEASRCILSPEFDRSRCSVPSRLIFLHVTGQAPRARAFQEDLSRAGFQIEERGLEYLGLALVDRIPEHTWHVAHTQDDALELALSRLTPGQDAVLIADDPQLRRSFNRAIQRLKIPLADSRDPSVLRMSEAVKSALLPLEVVASRFERSRVTEYLSMNGAWEKDFKTRGKVFEKIEALGIRQGLKNFEAVGSAGLMQELRALEKSFGGRWLLAHLSERHLDYLRERNHEWLLFFEGLWAEMILDFDVIESSDFKAPLLYWLSKLRERIEEAKPPALALKQAGGLRVYRLNQVPIGARAIRKLVVFGMHSRYLDEEGEGDLWFSERERLKLAADFGLRSAVQRVQEREQI
jgi:hypothetical protein